MGWKDLAVSLLPQCKDVYILANMGERICLLWQVIILLLSPLTSSESNSEIKLAKLVFFCLKLPEIPNSDLPLTLVVFRADIINLSQHFVYAELTKWQRKRQHINFPPPRFHIFTELLETVWYHLQHRQITHYISFICIWA